jgi:hypothetical protein
LKESSDSWRLPRQLRNDRMLSCETSVALDSTARRRVVRAGRPHLQRAFRVGDIKGMVSHLAPRSLGGQRCRVRRPRRLRALSIATLAACHCASCGNRGRVRRLRAGCCGNRPCAPDPRSKAKSAALRTGSGALAAHHRASGVCCGPCWNLGAETASATRLVEQG